MKDNKKLATTTPIRNTLRDTAQSHTVVPNVEYNMKQILIS